MKVSPHFDSREFACKHCGEVIINERLVEVLEKFRALIGCPVIINSGYRCPVHNANVGGVYNSQHVKGTAADIACPEGFSPEELIPYAEQAGADGIGLYDWGIHIDVRGEKARW